MAKVLEHDEMAAVVELLAVGALNRLQVASKDRPTLLGQRERLHAVATSTLVAKAGLAASQRSGHMAQNSRTTVSGSRMARA